MCNMCLFVMFRFVIQPTICGTPTSCDTRISLDGMWSSTVGLSICCAEERSSTRDMERSSTRDMWTSLISSFGTTGRLNLLSKSGYVGFSSPNSPLPQLISHSPTSTLPHPPHLPLLTHLNLPTFTNSSLLTHLYSSSPPSPLSQPALITSLNPEVCSCFPTYIFHFSNCTFFASHKQRAIASSPQQYM